MVVALFTKGNKNNTINMTFSITINKLNTGLVRKQQQASTYVVGSCLAETCGETIVWPSVSSSEKDLFGWGSSVSAVRAILLVRNAAQIETN
jgi:hypothetical protein